MIDFSLFEKKTNIFFNDKKLLEQAFIHRSYINENPSAGLSHNERLEFLGDAVLELIVTNFLYKKYPNYTEGELTALRSALVNAIIISEVALKIGMNEDDVRDIFGSPPSIAESRQYKYLIYNFNLVIVQIDVNGKVAGWSLYRIY